MSEGDEIRTVGDAFAEAGFAEPEYAFYPATNRVIRAIFRRLWLAPAVLLVLVLGVNLVTYLSLTGEGNRQQINDWLGDNVRFEMSPADYLELVDEGNRGQVYDWLGDYLIFSDEGQDIILLSRHCRPPSRAWPPDSTRRLASPRCRSLPFLAAGRVRYRIAARAP